MKNLLLLTLLVVGSMTTCGDNLEWQSKIEKKYNFAFNKKGECYSRKSDGISWAEFTEQVVGYGWKYVCGSEIDKGGNLSDEDYWIMSDGRSASQYYFESTNKLIDYFATTSFTPIEGQYGYNTRAYTFDDSKVYYDGEQDFYRLLILTANEDFIECVSYGNNTYVFSIYQRMTPEELEKVQQTYTQNWDEAE